MTHRGAMRRVRIAWLHAVATVLLPAVLLAQSPDQFGGQDRADAAARMSVLGVQQAISSLPPTSGQSLTYEFNLAADTYIISERLGPTALRSPETIGASKFSVRVAGSYFELADTFAPIPYVVNNSSGPIAVAKLWLRANAQVGLLNLAATYGFTERFDLSLNLPLVIVDANASQAYTARAVFASAPPPAIDKIPLSGVRVVDGNVQSALQGLDAALQPGGPLIFRRDTFTAIGFQFNDGTHAGVGRISVVAKGALYADRRVELTAAPEFFFPSPNQGEFAGPDSAAILPRVVGAFRVSDPLRLHADVGYDYDFNSDELRRFVWNTGASIALTGATFDVGVGGSKYDQGIKWTPTTAPWVGAGTGGTIQALGNNRLGDNFVDALGGIKLRVADKTVLSGTVSVPLNNEGFRPAAIGTLVVEQYF